MKHVRYFVTVIIVGTLCMSFIWVLSRHKSEYISTIIAPHHDLVAEQRSEFFKKVAPKTQGRPIILLAPNHYDVGVDDILTTSRPFTTQDRTIDVNQKLYEAAIGSGATASSIVFETEHGIKSLLPDIATYYPDQTFIPIVIKSSATRPQIKSVLEALYKSCSDCLLIASADFSHYQPHLLSELHDKVTLRALQKLDGESIETITETEPMHVVWAAIQWAQQSNTKRFELDNHTNSTSLGESYYSEGTTHFFGYYGRGKMVQPDKLTTFTIAGSIQSLSSGKISSETFSLLGERVLWGTDVVAGSVASGSDQDSYDVLDYLHKLHFTHVFTENESLIKQIKETTKMEILIPSQSATVKGEEISLKIRQLDGATLIQGKLPEKIDDGYSIEVVDWSGAQNFDEQMAITYCEKLVDNGADLVVGVGYENITKAHYYNEKLIVPSLGAFVGGSNTNSIVLVGSVNPDRVEIQPLLIGYHDEKPILERSKEKDSILIDIFSSIEDKIIDERGGLLYSLPL